MLSLAGNMLPLGLRQVGALVVKDVKPYEFMKLRLLNGGHSCLSYISVLCGYNYVDDAMANPLISGERLRLRREVGWLLFCRVVDRGWRRWGVLTHRTLHITSTLHMLTAVNTRNTDMLRLYASVLTTVLYH